MATFSLQKSCKRTLSRIVLFTEHVMGTIGMHKDTNLDVERPSEKKRVKERGSFKDSLVVCKKHDTL